jgi:hypothetical protein
MNGDDLRNGSLRRRCARSRAPAVIDGRRTVKPSGRSVHLTNDEGATPAGTPAGRGSQANAMDSELVNLLAGPRLSEIMLLVAAMLALGAWRRGPRGPQ